MRYLTMFQVTTNWVMKLSFDAMVFCCRSTCGNPVRSIMIPGETSDRSGRHRPMLVEVCRPTHRDNSDIVPRRNVRESPQQFRSAPPETNAAMFHRGLRRPLTECLLKVCWPNKTCLGHHRQSRVVTQESTTSAHHNAARDKYTGKHTRARTTHAHQPTLDCVVWAMRCRMQDGIWSTRCFPTIPHHVESISTPGNATQHVGLRQPDRFASIGLGSFAENLTRNAH